MFSVFFTERVGECCRPKVREPVSLQMVSAVMKKSLRLVCVDTTQFSCIAMRRGGISVALAAKAPAPVLYLQSGHGKAQNYMVQLDPSNWYENFAALQL